MKSLKTFALAAAATLAGMGAAAAQEALTTADVNMRAGPGSRFPVVTTVPEDREVFIHGCLSDFEWCDVSWRRQRGWVFSDYLEGSYGQGYVPFYEYRRRTSLPVITFGFNYWDRNYRDRPWFDDWDRWGGRDRDRVRVRDRDRDRDDDRARDRDRDGNQARDGDRDDDRDGADRNRVRDRDGNRVRDRDRNDDQEDGDRVRNRDGNQARDRNRNDDRNDDEGTRVRDRDGNQTRDRNRTRGNDDSGTRRGGDQCDEASQDTRCNDAGQRRNGPSSIVEDEDMMP